MSRWEEGSSRKVKSVSCARTLATDTLCCSPPESVVTFLRENPSRSTSERQSSARLHVFFAFAFENSQVRIPSRKHYLECAEGKIEIRGLREKRYFSVKLLCLVSRDILSVKHDAACVGIDYAGKKPEKRGFPCAVRADYAQKLVSSDLEGLRRRLWFFRLRRN